MPVSNFGSSVCKVLLPSPNHFDCVETRAKPNLAIYCFIFTGQEMFEKSPMAVGDPATAFEKLNPELGCHFHKKFYYCVTAESGIRLFPLSLPHGCRSDGPSPW
jgi:hypothetical protein